MPTREDDDLDIVAGLSASRDDTPNTDKIKQSAPRRAAQSEPAQPTPAHRESQARNGTEKTSQSVPAMPKRGNGLIWLMVLLLLVVIGACGWLGQQVLQLQQQQANSDNALQLERSRMESISAQVHETGSSFVETGNVLETKFSFFESEIRKLWDVSNKRNREAIAENAAQLKKSTQTFEAKLQALDKDRAAVAATVEKMNNRLASDNSALRTVIEVQNEQLLLMEGELELLKQRLNKLPNDLSARVAKNEEAVRAIDASRQLLVKRYSELQQRLDDLSPTLAQ